MKTMMADKDFTRLVALLEAKILADIKISEKLSVMADPGMKLYHKGCLDMSKTYEEFFKKIGLL